MKPFIPYFISFLPCALPALARCTYSKSADITGSAFFDEFHFFNTTDPTHGRVTYVNEQTARQHNLTHATQDSFLLRADHTTILEREGPGRMSFRIVSNRRVTTSVLVFDIRHMPEGLGTWPAVWTLGDDWPNKGEIDILEGVNNASPNSATLHTGSNCRMPSSRDMTGRSIGDNCAAYETSNQGCGVRFPGSNSFGPSFNSNGGGWFAMERNINHIKVWFWPRDDEFVPSQIRFGSSQDVVEPDDWDVPAAFWPNDRCDIAKHFGPHNIIINLTLCGDWAGNAWHNSTCPRWKTCKEFVDNNPAGFRNAYFDIAALRIYE